MSNFKFGERSENELATCNPQLVNVMRKALSLSDVDFGIVQGARTIEAQREAYKTGHSKVNPDAYDELHLYNAAKHVTGPGMPTSRACDIIVSGGKTYDASTLCYISGVVLTCAKNMGINMRWGGNWDSDGVIITDQTLNDLVHFELT